MGICDICGKYCNNKIKLHNSKYKTACSDCFNLWLLNDDFEIQKLVTKKEGRKK